MTATAETPTIAEAIARRNELAERWLPLVHRIAKKFRGSRADPDDLVGIGNLALVIACSRADPGDPRLKHHLARPIRWAMRGEIRRAHFRREWDYDHLENVIDRRARPGAEDRRDHELRAARVLIGRVLPMLPPHQRLMVRLAFGMGGDRPMSQRELARELGVSQVAVWGVIHRALERMRRAIPEEEVA